MIDLRTPNEKRRAARHGQICSDFLQLRNDAPETAKSRFFNVLAEKYGMTSMGIRSILQRNKLI